MLQKFYILHLPINKHLIKNRYKICLFYFLRPQNRMSPTWHTRFFSMNCVCCAIETPNSSQILLIQPKIRMGGRSLRLTHFIYLFTTIKSQKFWHTHLKPNRLRLIYCRMCPRWGHFCVPRWRSMLPGRPAVYRHTTINSTTLVHNERIPFECCASESEWN